MTEGKLMFAQQAVGERYYVFTEEADAVGRSTIIASGIKTMADAAMICRAWNTFTEEYPFTRVELTDD